MLHDDDLVTLRMTGALLSTTVKGVEYTIIGTRKRGSSEQNVDVVKIDGAKVVQFDLLAPKVNDVSATGKELKRQVEKFRDLGVDGTVRGYQKHHDTYLAEARSLLQKAAEEGHAKRAIVVNCSAGRLRTSIMAAFLYREITNELPSAVIDKVRASRTGGALTEDQWTFVRAALEGEGT
jgi:hypothetical protein